MAELSAALTGILGAVVLVVVAWRLLEARGAARRALAPILVPERSEPVPLPSASYLPGK